MNVWMKIKKEPISIQSVNVVLVQPNLSVSFKKNKKFKSHSSKLKLQMKNKIIHIQLIRNMCALLQFNEKKSSKWKLCIQFSSFQTSNVNLVTFNLSRSQRTHFNQNFASSYAMWWIFVVTTRLNQWVCLSLLSFVAG